MALVGAIGFALGTVLAKKLPLRLAAGVGRGLADRARLPAGGDRRASPIENTHLAGLSELDWMLLAYSTVIQFCVAYVCWFAALARLPASVAAIGTMAVPVIGVVGFGAGAARTARRRPDRGPGLHAGRRRAGDAIVMTGA